MEAERMRAEQYLERKAQSIAFRDSVARELEESGLRYRRDVCTGGRAADFLVEGKGGRIVLECRFNTQRDFEKAIVTAQILAGHHRCSAAWIVVPFGAEVLGEQAWPHGVEVVELGDLRARVEGFVE